MRTASDAHMGLRTDSVARAAVPERIARSVATVQATNASFERAVSPCLPTLRLQALRLTRNVPDSDDLLQETLLRAYRFWPRYQERDQCRAWLQRILYNVFRSEYRRQVRRRAYLSEQQAHETIAPSTGPDAPADEELRSTRENAELDERLSRGLSCLSVEHRDVIWLVDVKERSYREAANELECPIGTVMSRLHRARSALRSALLAQP